MFGEDIYFTKDELFSVGRGWQEFMVGRNLIGMVGGCSAGFFELGPVLKDKIIVRRESVVALLLLIKQALNLLPPDSIEMLYTSMVSWPAVMKN